jgi:pilus assembly protein Flp/PilA
MLVMASWLTSRLTREEGATMVEYGLMVALIAVVCLVAVGLIGTNLNATFTAIAGAIN